MDDIFLNPDSPRSPEGSPTLEDTLFINDDSDLGESEPEITTNNKRRRPFSQSPEQEDSPNHTKRTRISEPPQSEQPEATNQIQIDADTDNDDDFIQEKTPEPVMTKIKTGKKKGQLRAKAIKTHRAEKTLFTWSNLPEKFTEDQVLEAMSSWRYKLREFSACYERHKATRDENNNIIAPGAWHIHMVGIITKNDKGAAPNIKNPRAFDLKIGRHVMHPNYSAALNLSHIWYVKISSTVVHQN
jgi:hypothetical protein